MFPNFFVIGAAKSATSSLCGIIDQHPDIFMCKPKEPRYFQLPQEEYDAKWEWYLSLFANAGACKAVGEGSVIYSARPLEGEWLPPQRIHERFPGARLIYVVRDPLDRIVSNWKMLHYLEPNVFTDFNVDVLHPKGRRWYTDRSKYWFQIQAWRAFFPDEQILILFYEDFVADPAPVLKKVCQFLNTDDGYAFQDLKRRKMAATDRRKSKPVFNMVKALPGYKSIRQMIPRDLTDRIRKSPLLTEDRNVEPVWDPQVKAKVVEELKPDLKQFLDHAGKDAHYWNLAGISTGLC